MKSKLSSHSLKSHPHHRQRIYRSQPESWVIHDTTAHHVLNLIHDRAAACKHKPPACVFDLDGTLFDVGPRTLGIVKQWLNSEHAKDFSPDLLQVMQGFHYDHLGYSLAHLFDNSGLSLEDTQTKQAFLSVEKMWKNIFFSGEAVVEYDQLFQNGREFLQAIQSLGIVLVYLTGRSVNRMYAGTLEQLQKFSLPMEKYELILKSDPKQEDHLFKAEEIKKLTERFEVVGNFENEYGNLAHMSFESPQAIHVIMDTQHSGRHAPEVACPIYRIQSYDLSSLN